MTTASTACTERTVTVRDGVRLAVRDQGPIDADATVVLLHGLCLEQGSWAGQIRHLTRRWGARVRVVSYDHRGHGRSDSAPTSTYVVEQLATDLADVLAALDVTGPLTLVGHSMGGMVALAYLGRRPADRPVEPHGVVLVATAAGRLAERGVARLLASPATDVLCKFATRAPQRAFRLLTKPVRAVLFLMIRRPPRSTLTSLFDTALARHPSPPLSGSSPPAVLRPILHARLHSCPDDHHQRRRGPPDPSVPLPRPGRRHPRRHTRAHPHRRAHASSRGLPCSHGRHQPYDRHGHRHRPGTYSAGLSARTTVFTAREGSMTAASH
jgi:pimeloyl-ACP methyl ester carboxylesterase